MKHTALKPGDTRKEGDEQRVTTGSYRHDDDDKWHPVPESFHGHELFGTDFITLEYRRGKV